jgi:WD40 repeat protein
MRFLQTGLLGLLLFLSIAAQPGKDPFTLNGRLGLSDKDEGIGIVQTISLGKGNRFLIVGKRQVQLWDIPSARLVNSYFHKITGVQHVGFLMSLLNIPNHMEVNSEGTRGILVSKDPNAKLGENMVAAVWNLETGERLALLDRAAKPFRSAFFSENGATIMSLHGELKQAELSFWDPATFEHRTSIKVQDLSFQQLSRDGEHVYIGSAKANKWLGITVVGFETSKGIELWNTRTGKLEKTYTDGDIKFWNPLNSSPVVSRDEKYMAARSEGNKIVVWETAGDGSPKYAIPASDPKKKVRLVGISDDSRYLLTRTDEEAEVYELTTGKLYRNFRLSGDSTFDLSPDSKYAIRRSQGSVGVYDLESEKYLYSLRLRVDTETRENEPSYEYQVEGAQVSPDSKYIMVYGDRDVRIYDMITGEPVQSLVDPQRVKYKDNGKIKNNGLDNNRAGWLASGNSIYVFGDDGRSFLLWNKK